MLAQTMAGFWGHGMIPLPKGALGHTTLAASLAEVTDARELIASSHEHFPKTSVFTTLLMILGYVQVLRRLILWCVRLPRDRQAGLYAPKHPSEGGIIPCPQNPAIFWAALDL